MSEKLRFDELTGNGGQFNVTNGARAPLAPLMQRRARSVPCPSRLAQNADTRDSLAATRSTATSSRGAFIPRMHDLVPCPSARAQFAVLHFE